MTYSARHELARLLAGESSSSRHSASMTLPAESLKLTVQGFGPVPLPLRAAATKKLIALAEPAHVGKGTETLLDDSVRDTWQIPSGLVAITSEQWDQALRRSLRELGARLGIPPAARLRPELHSLLVYGQGQFFAPHQDSEKGDGMVATLVVTLPTSHSGGELVIDDGGEAVEYRASDYDLTLVAFYADRRHEVRPVRRGYRASLTFNLILETGQDAGQGPAGAAAELLREHFSTPADHSWRRSGQPPDVLGFFLDHEYSQLGLTSELLKGADIHRVATLAAAAELAGCEYAFAHADVQETHAAHEQHSPEWGWWDDVEEVEDPESDLRIGELVDSYVTLTWWSDPQAEGSIRLHLGEDEICAVTPSEVKEPYQSEYEGYMGNYGNTLERWYYRTAMLIWPTERGSDLRAEANPEWALSRIAADLSAGNLAVARVQARALIPVVSRVPSSSLVELLGVASGVDDPDLAHLLLKPFSITALDPDHAPLLAQLCETYGIPWWEHLLNTWPLGYREGTSQENWIQDVLSAICAELIASSSRRVAVALLHRVTSELERGINRALRNRPPERRRWSLKQLGPMAAALIHAAARFPSIRTKMVDLLLAPGEAALPLLTSTLQSWPNRRRSKIRTRLAEETYHFLTDALNRPERAPGDWSISWQSPGGDDADRLAEFLQSEDERVLEWPLAGPRRKQIHGLIDTAGLPVRHVTRRTGSPFTLVLTKTPELFTRERDLREQQRRDQRWLEKHFLNR